MYIGAQEGKTRENCAGTKRKSKVTVGHRDTEPQRKKKFLAAKPRSHGDSLRLWGREVGRKMTDKIVVLVTCGSAKQAQRIARMLVEKRLAACGNIFQAPVKSIYRWKGKVESAKEYLLVIKSSRRRFGALREMVKRLHSYDVPEIIALPIVEGSGEYLKWIEECVGAERPRRKA